MQAQPSTSKDATSKKSLIKIVRHPPFPLLTDLPTEPAFLPGSDPFSTLPIAVDVADEEVASVPNGVALSSGDAPLQSLMAPYVIVGAGAAAASAVREIMRQDPEASVLVIGNERAPPYRKPLLSKDLWTDVERRQETLAMLLNFEWSDYATELFPLHDEARRVRYVPDASLVSSDAHVPVTFILGKTVETLNPQEKTIQLDDGVIISYGKLLLAMGSAATALPSDFMRFDNVINYGTIESFVKLASLVEPASSTAYAEGAKLVLQGSGFVSLELASSLNKLQPAAVMHVLPGSGPLSAVLPNYLSSWLSHRLADLAITQKPHVIIEDIVAAEGAQQVNVKLSNGEEVLARAVVFDSPWNPNTDLALAAGLSLDQKTHGLMTDAFLRCSPDIFVAGDLCTLPKEVVPLGPDRVTSFDNAVSTGTAVGYNMVAAAKNQPLKAFTPQVSVVSCNIADDIRLQFFGRPSSTFKTVGFWKRLSSASQVQSRSIMDIEKGVLLYLDSSRIVGIVTLNMDARARDLSLSTLNDNSTLEADVEKVGRMFQQLF